MNGDESVVEQNTFRDLGEATQQFYAKIAETYHDQNAAVHLHDLVQSKTLASWQQDDDEECTLPVANPDLGVMDWDRSVTL
jgi:hypothetical protein